MEVPLKKIDEEAKVNNIAKKRKRCNKRRFKT